MQDVASMDPAPTGHTNDDTDQESHIPPGQPSPSSPGPSMSSLEPVNLIDKLEKAAFCPSPVVVAPVNEPATPVEKIKPSSQSPEMPGDGTSPWSPLCPPVLEKRKRDASTVFTPSPDPNVQMECTETDPKVPKLNEGEGDGISSKNDDLVHPPPPSIGSIEGQSQHGAENVSFEGEVAEPPVPSVENALESGFAELAELERIGLIQAFRSTPEEEWSDKSDKGDRIDNAAPVPAFPVPAVPAGWSAPNADQASEEQDVQAAGQVADDGADLPEGSSPSVESEEDPKALAPFNIYGEEVANKPGQQSMRGLWDPPRKKQVYVNALKPSAENPHLKFPDGWVPHPNHPAFDGSLPERFPSTIHELYQSFGLKNPYFLDLRIFRCHVY